METTAAIGTSGPSDSSGRARFSAASGRRIIELDGLRGLAILLVVVYHYVAIGPQSAPGTFLAYARSAFLMGWCGVDLFFVLSGFLIGGILLDVRQSPRFFGTFYLRRVHRIIPVYYAFVLSYMVAAAFLSSAGGPLRTSSPTWRFLPVHLAFLQNFRPRSGTDFTNACLSPLWSLAVEEQFYLAVPLLVWFLSRRRLVALLLAAVVVAPILRTFLLLHGHPGGMYILTPSRMDALSLGVLAAIVWRTPAVRGWMETHPRALHSALLVSGLGALSLALLAPSPQSLLMASAGFSTLALFFSVLLLTVVTFPAGAVGSFFRFGGLREFGGISYCMYLIHMPLNPVVHWLVRRERAGFRTPAEIATTALCFLIVWAITKVSFRFFENPLTQWGHRFKY